MVKSERRLKELASVLNRNNDEASVIAVLSLRDEEAFEGAVALLADHYDRTVNTHLLRTIEAFFNDLKDPAVCPEVIAEIKKQRKNRTTVMILSSCWQSGLDYSVWAVDFTGIFLEGDYAIALECLTIIENSLEKVSKGNREKMRKMISEGKIPSESEKSPLAADLIDILT